MRNTINALNINQTNGRFHSFDIILVKILEILLKMKFFTSNITVLHNLPIGADGQLIQNQMCIGPHQKKMLHNALARTTSHQPSNAELQMIQSTLESMSPTENHRKLERTQSEPAPLANNAQLNTSRLVEFGARFI